MTGNAPSPDLFLARRAAAGHADAWEQLVDQYGKRLYNLAYQFAGTPEEAEDLTQEIFIRLYKSLKSYRGETPLIGWALRLSRNLCIDHYRKNKREKSWHKVADTVLDMLPAVDDVEAESARRQQVTEVYAAMADLPEEYSEPILLCDLQGWSIEETASSMDIPKGTVKTRLHRGRQRLADAVHARMEERRRESEEISAKGAAPC